MGLRLGCCEWHRGFAANILDIESGLGSRGWNLAVAFFNMGFGTGKGWKGQGKRSDGERR